MNPIQEAKQELEASIRYAENAISSAQATIESMGKYQEQTGREKALQNQLDELKSEGGRQAELIDDMRASAFADANTIKHLKEANMSLVCDNDDLKDKVQELESKVQGQYDDIVMLQRDVEFYTKKYNELVKQKEASSGPCGCQAYRDIEEAQGRAEGEVELLQRTIADLEAQVNALEQPERPTMPVIPKAVAIAIFREGMAYGAGNVCDELDNATDIEISETGYTGGFEVSFTKYFDLSDHLDTDYLRSKAVDNSDEEWVVDCLKTLCADNKFECRIHGVDNKES